VCTPGLHEAAIVWRRGNHKARVLQRTCPGRDSLDLKHKKCANRGCTKQPSFGVEETTKQEYYGGHAREGMVDFRNNKCVHQGCKMSPSFRVTGTTKREYCAGHSKEGMVNVATRTRGRGTPAVASTRSGITPSPFSVLDGSTTSNNGRHPRARLANQVRELSSLPIDPTAARESYAIIGPSPFPASSRQLHQERMLLFLPLLLSRRRMPCFLQAS